MPPPDDGQALPDLGHFNVIVRYSVLRKLTLSYLIIKRCPVYYLLTNSLEKYYKYMEIDDQ